MASDQKSGIEELPVLDLGRHYPELQNIFEEATYNAHWKKMEPIKMLCHLKWNSSSKSISIYLTCQRSTITKWIKHDARCTINSKYQVKTEYYD